MNIHKYILEPYNGMKSRYICPNCNARDKTFSLYIDNETGECIHYTVGRCSRENNCGYHYSPKQYFLDNNIPVGFSKPKTYLVKVPSIEAKPKPISYISFGLFKSSLKRQEENNFVTFLIGIFGITIASELIGRYFIGTSKYWNGATVFWQIDILGNVRTGKIMLYNPTTGKRIKEPINHINWVHKVIKFQNFKLRQCMFGEHLLIDKTKPVAIVESEKTAVIASIYLPQFIWLAVGSINNLSLSKCTILKGRSVTLFPDIKGYEKWQKKRCELSSIANINISNLLEIKATIKEREQGLDIADYLIRYNYNLFKQPNISHKSGNIINEFPEVYQFKKPNQSNTIEVLDNKSPRVLNENWDTQIVEIERFFKDIDLPNKPININKTYTILNIQQFVNNHLVIVKKHNGKNTFKPFLDRLIELKRYLTR